METGFVCGVSLCLVALIFTVLTPGSGEVEPAAPKMHECEVSALKVIALKLNKTNWDFTVDPCSGSSSWVTPIPETEEIFANNVSCECTASVCHIVSIKLNGQNLSGILPEEFSNLTFLRTLDLTRNYLNGSIPISWTSLPLEELLLLGNRISGTIPKELGRVTTLISLNIQDNSLGGALPPELGNLVNLYMFLASGNNFSGPLPQTYALLKNLSDFRIDGSSITGKVPEFIGNWTKLYRLEMQGTLMEGPFPSTLSQLHRLRALRISDLGKSNNTFPSLEKMRSLYYLVLRNCSIFGEIPPYLGKLNLNTLDLSFNNLIGGIPGTFEGMETLEFMYLTNNKLTGEIPSWMLKSEHTIDVSYNVFTGSPPPSCSAGNSNYFASYLSSDNSSIAPCLRKNFPCSKLARSEFGGRGIFCSVGRTFQVLLTIRFVIAPHGSKCAITNKL